MRSELDGLGALNVLFDSTYGSPGKMLNDAHMKLSRGLMKTLEEQGAKLQVDAWAMLNVLWAGDRISQVELSGRLARDRHQVSRLVDTLVRQGFVRREADKNDRRVKYVVLTEWGRAQEDSLKEAVVNFLERTFNGVSQRDYDGFTRCLEHILER